MFPSLTPRILLASFVLFLVSLSNALPTNLKKPRSITLPLKRLHGARDDVHPLVLYQQHHNRAIRRLARFTGREAPTSEELHERLLRLLWIPPNGVPKAHASKSTDSDKRQFHKSDVDIRFHPYGTHKNNPDVAGSSSQNGPSNVAAPQSTSDPSSSSTSTSSSSNSSSADDDGPPFSEIDLEASINGDLTPANTPTAANSLGLAIEANDVGYVATIQIGTPPTNFNILMDSGSSDFWVGSENCVTLDANADEGCGNHTFLGSQSSSTFTDLQQQFSVSYGSGEVSGDLVTDNVAIAGMQLPQHTFGVANVESEQFSFESVIDGLMGVALQSLSQEGVPTPVQSLATAGLISAPIISFKISRLADQLNDGEVTFGGLDTSKFNSSTLVTLDNVNAEGFWEGSLDAASVNGVDLGFQGRTTIFDTGTTLMIVPTADADAIHAAIPGAAPDGQGGFTLPCTLTDSLVLIFGGQEFAIDPRDLAFLPVDNDDLSGTCESGIQAGEVGGPDEWLLGDVFLKNAYFSTDISTNAISLAVLV